LTKNLDFFLDILRDMLTQPAFDVREIVTLQGIIQGELKSRLQEPKALAKRAAIKRAYRGTSAEGFVLGTIDSVSHIRPIDADRFFKARYVRENMVIGVVSPFSDREVVAKIESKLDTVLSGVLDASRLPEVAVAGTGRHAVIVDRKGMATTPVYIVIPGVGDADPDISTLELGNFVFGADFTSRLIQVLRAENGWTYGAYSGFQQLIGAKAAPALFSIYTFPSVEYASLAIPKAVSMLEDYASLGVSESEFQDARDALGNRYAFEMDSAEKRLALKMRQALSGRPFLRPEEYRQGLAQLDKFILNQVILRRTLVSDMVIAAVGDPALLKPILSALPFVKSVEVLDIIP
jgi:zinc protease